MKNKNKRVYITTSTVGQSFGTVGLILRHHPGCRDHGKLLAETDVKPFRFVAAALNAAVDLAANRGWLVVDEDWQP